MSVFGKRKTVTIGGFPCAVYGSLLQEEEEWFEGKELERIDMAIPLLELAAAIAQDKGISEDEALALVQSFSDTSNPNAALLASYTKELKSLTETIRFEKGFPSAIATLAIQSRVKQSFLEEHAEDLQESFDVAFKGQWREEDTRKLPTSLISELALFMIGERKGESIEADEDKALGESSTVSTSSDPPPVPTGKNSTAKSRKRESAIQPSMPETSTAPLAS